MRRPSQSPAGDSPSPRLGWTRGTTAPTSSIESPRPAKMGTGSKPPSTTDVITGSTLPTTWTLAKLPPGTVPGNNATYTVLSPAESDWPAELLAADRVLRIGSEAMRPDAGGGGGQLTQGLSEQPPSEATIPSVAATSTVVPYRVI